MQIYEVTHYLPYVCPNCDGQLKVVGVETSERLVIGLHCPHCNRDMEIELIINGERNAYAEGYAQYELYLNEDNPYRDEYHAKRFRHGVDDARGDEIPF